MEVYINKKDWDRVINYAMRTQFSAKPLSKLEQSEINLDNSSGLKTIILFIMEKNT